MVSEETALPAEPKPLLILKKFLFKVHCFTKKIVFLMHNLVGKDRQNVTRNFAVIECVLI